MINILRNRLIPMFISIIITSLGAVPLFFLQPGSKEFVFACYPFIQIGLAIMINTSTSLISDVIGKDAESSAFVYGFYSFMEKVANGIAIERALSLYGKDKTGLRLIMSGLPIICSVVAFLLTYVGKMLNSEYHTRMTTTAKATTII